MSDIPVDFVIKNVPYFTTSDNIYDGIYYILDNDLFNYLKKKKYLYVSHHPEIYYLVNPEKILSKIFQVVNVDFMFPQSVYFNIYINDKILSTNKYLYLDDIYNIAKINPPTLSYMSLWYEHLKYIDVLPGKQPVVIYDTVIEGNDVFLDELKSKSCRHLTEDLIYIGKGAYGKVQLICKNKSDDHCYVTKITYLYRDVEKQEIIDTTDINNLAAKYNLSAPIYYISTCKLQDTTHIFKPTSFNIKNDEILISIMCYIKGDTLFDKLYKRNYSYYLDKVFDAIENLHRIIYPHCHGDMSYNNIIITPDDEVMFIDFTRSHRENQARDYANLIFYLLTYHTNTTYNIKLFKPWIIKGFDNMLKLETSQTIKTTIKDFRDRIDGTSSKKVENMLEWFNQLVHYYFYQ